MKTKKMQPVQPVSPIDKLEKEKREIQLKIGEYFVKNIKLSELYFWAMQSIDSANTKDGFDDQRRHAIGFLTCLTFVITDKIDQPLTPEIMGAELVEWFSYYDYEDAKEKIKDISGYFFAEYSRIKFDAESLDKYVKTLGHMVQMIEMFRHYEFADNEIYELQKAA